MDSFVSNLGRIYAIYTGSFLAFVIVLAVLEQMGMPDQWIGYAFVLLTIGVYAGIGYISRTAQVSEYYVAGRRVPAFYNGMATAADWMSAASFIGMAGSLYLQGYDGLAFVLGWTGGYVLVAVLVAPYLRKFGAYTVPDFLAARYEGNVARFVGVIVLISCSFIYLMGQLTGTGLVMSRLIGIPFEYGVFVGLAGILVCSMLGGMRAVTWTQVAQYIVLIIAYLIPVIILSTQITGVPVPQIMYGGVLEQVTELERTAPYIAPYVGEAKGHATAFWFRDPLNFFGLIFCLMIGTASLPHVIMRYFTTPSVREARKSVGWSLLFIFILYFTAPAYAVFAKYEVFTNVLGKDISTLEAIAALPGWIFTYGKLGLVKICGANAASPDAIFAACQAVKDAAGAVVPVTQLTFNQFTIAADTIVLATPEIAGLPYVIAGLVAAGGLAAALSTADGLLLAIANALSHDVYYQMVDHTASTKRRLDGRPDAADRRGAARGLYRDHAAAEHPDLRQLGILGGGIGAVRGAGTGCLVDAHHGDGGRGRHGRRVRGVHLVHVRHRVLRRAAAVQGDRADGKGALQSLRRPHRHPALVPGDDRGQLGDQGALARDAGLHRVDPHPARRRGDDGGPSGRLSRPGRQAMAAGGAFGPRPCVRGETKGGVAAARAVDPRRRLPVLGPDLDHGRPLPARPVRAARVGQLHLALLPSRHRPGAGGGPAGHAGIHGRRVHAAGRRLVAVRRPASCSTWRPTRSTGPTC